MALQHSHSLPSGIHCIAAYTRIQDIRHTHLETIVSVETWASEEARHDGKATIFSGSYSVPWHDEVSLTSAYTALKGFPEFSEAADV